MYGNNNIDPFLSTQTRTTNYSPLQSAIQQARDLRMTANTSAEGSAVGGLNNQIGYLNNGLNTANQSRQPYTSVGAASMQAAGNLANPQSAASLNALRADPVLQNIIDQGTLALNKNASATGNRFSGSHALDLMRMAQDATNGYIGDLFNRNYNLAQIGSQQAGQQAANQYQYGQDAGNTAANLGQVRADASLARGEIGANAALDSAKTQVAQSTVAGLLNGQIAGRNSGNQLPMVGSTDNTSYAPQITQAQRDAAANPGVTSYGGKGGGGASGSGTLGGGSSLGSGMLGGAASPASGTNSTSYGSAPLGSSNPRQLSGINSALYGSSDTTGYYGTQGYGTGSSYAGDSSVTPSSVGTAAGSMLSSGGSTEGLTPQEVAKGYYTEPADANGYWLVIPNPNGPQHPPARQYVHNSSAGAGAASAGGYLGNMFSQNAASTPTWTNGGK